MNPPFPKDPTSVGGTIAGKHGGKIKGKGSIGIDDCPNACKYFAINLNRGRNKTACRELRKIGDRI